MCGYCIETAVISDLLAATEGDRHEPRDRMLCTIHLQEAADWRAELSSWASGDHTSGGLVALCRIWSERIAGDVGAPLSEVLDAGALSELVEAVSHRRTQRSLPPFLASVSHSPREAAAAA